MKSWKKMFLVLAVVLALCGCSTQDVSLPGQIDLLCGERRQLSELATYNGPELDGTELLAAINEAQRQGAALVFASTAPSVVTVSDEGILTANLPGEATVVVLCEALGYRAEIGILVCDLPGSVTLPAVLELTKGQTKTLYTQEGLTGLAWTSSDATVATIDETGAVTALSDGEAVITAAVPGTSLRADCTVYVGAAVRSVALSRAELELPSGQRHVLAVHVRPDPLAEVTWRSSDEAVATVDPTGIITAVGGGTAQITATAGGKTACCTVTVPETATPETAISETEQIEPATPETAEAKSATPETAVPETAETEPATPETATSETAKIEPAASETATPETAQARPATPKTATPETAAGEEELQKLLDDIAAQIRNFFAEKIT